MLEHSNMARMRNKHPDWIWNRSDTHVILGVPSSHEAFKTPVEPGNSFSPGVGSYGVSTWVYVDGQLHAPEEKALEELKWSFLERHSPVVVSEWKAGEIEVKSRLFSDGDAILYDVKDYFALELHNPTSRPVDLKFYLVIRSFGAAGAPIHSLGWQEDVLVINGAPVLYASQSPSAFGALSYAESATDISTLLKTGKLPLSTSVTDESTWASGALEYTLTLQPGGTRQFDFVCHVHANHPKLKWLRVPGSKLSVNEYQNAFIKKWQDEQKIRLDLPDRRFADAFFAQLMHLYMFTVYDEPRITPVSYPLWWLRDGAYVVNALNKGGYHDFAERSILGVADRDAFGGFGAEGDGPGNGIWMLSEHYLLTDSLNFLREVYPHIERKADLIIQMLRTDKPILRPSGFRTAGMLLSPDSDLMCLPSEQGMIMGRMDHHFPIMWINAYAYFGLRRAALCAEALGIDGSRFVREADQLQATLQRRTQELFNKNDRNPNSAFWPTGWAFRNDVTIQESFEHFWNTVRCPNGKYTRDELWTYFEAGQAHNFLIFGQPDRAWTTIEYFLNEQIAPGLYTYSESNTDENTSFQWQRTRGWDHIHFVTPHGWTAAELFLLLRDCLAREEEDKLIIGSGIPAAWLTENFAVRHLPTYFGELSFSYDPVCETLSVEVDRLPTGGIHAGFPAQINLQVVSKTIETM